MKINIFIIIMIALCTGLQAEQTGIVKTKLMVTVLNDTGNRVEGVKVTLYTSKKDYQERKNPVGEPQLTNAKGFTTFKNLASEIYFIHAEKGDMDNTGSGTSTLEKLDGRRINKINTIITDF